MFRKKQPQDPAETAAEPSALLQLSIVPSGKVPFVQQTTAADCGAACLAMVLKFFGKHLHLEEVRRAVGTNRDGTNLMHMLEAADFFGLRGRGVSMELEGLRHLPRGSILFWDFNHFVVFEKLHAKGVDIVDPSVGRRRVPTTQFSRLFTGVAATFEPKENFFRESRREKSIWRLLREVLTKSKVIERILAVSMLLQLFPLALPILTGSLVDRVIPRGDEDLLVALVAIFGGVILFHLLFTWCRERLLLYLRTQMDLMLTFGFVEHLIDLPYSFFGQRTAGDLLMRLNSNATVREIISSTVLAGLLDSLMVGITLFILFWICPQMALLALFFGLMQLALVILTRRRQRELMAQNLETQARAVSYQVELLTGMESLKSMGAEKRALEHWSHLFVGNLNVLLQQGRLGALFNSLHRTLTLAAPLMVLALGGFLVLRGQLTLGTMLSASALSHGFLIPLSTLVPAAIQLQLLGSYFDRIQDVMSHEKEKNLELPALAKPLKGHLRLEDVSFSYGPLSSPVVQHISLEIPPGQHVAMVGKSGSGKSTLARLMLGLYPPITGRLFFDGMDLKRLNPRALRSHLGIVTQEPQLFSGSIRDNIALSAPEKPLEAVVKAAKTAAVHEDILEMPMGYETILADRGLSLSGGQRQRITIARALLNTPSILLLDEATSAVDAQTERKIYEELEKLKCTRITIAHRLATVKNADVILVLEEGKLVEQGTYQELVEQKGLFSEMVEGQRLKV